MALTQVSTDGIKNGTITGTDLATNVDLVDDQKLRLGTGNDLEIFHDGNHSRINDAGTGALIVSASKFQINNAAGNEVQAFFLQNGTSALYYDNSKKFETTSTGVTVTGTVTATSFSGETVVGDPSPQLGNSLDMNGQSINGGDSAGVANNRIKLGTGDDLQIYHDGSNSYIEDAGTGDLIAKVSASNFRMRGAGNAEIAKFGDDGSVDLYYNGSKKFETTTDGATVTGSLGIGTTSPATIFHVKTFNPDIHLENTGTGTGQLRLGHFTNGAFIGTYNDDGGGSDVLRLGTHSGNERMRITSDGKVGIGTTSPGNVLDVRGSAHAKVLVGTTGTGHATGLQISHAQGNAALQEWQLQTDASADGNLIVRNATTGTATMFFDADDNSVGIGTTSPAAKLHLNGGTYAAPTGGIGSFTQFVISNQSAGQGAGISLLGAGNMVTFINFGDSDDENVGAIVYNNVVDSMQFYVNASERMNIDSSGNLNINNDSGKLRVGTHADLEIFHNGSHSFIRDTGTGTLRIETSQMNVIKADGSETMATFVEDGAVQLFYDNTKRFETVSNGSSINGKTFCKGHNLGNGEQSIECHLRSDTNQYIHGIHFAGHGQINGSTYSAMRFVINGSGGVYGSITYTSGGTSYNSQSSDKRSKKNFEDWTDSVLPDFKSLKPQLFNYILQEDGEVKYKGYTAQDNVAAFPEAYPLVDDRYMFNPSGMVHYLMKAMQELVSKVEVLETEVAALKAN